MAETYTHRSVLLDEAVQALSIGADGIYVDATFGRGGHTQAILARLGEGGRLLAIDKDPAAVQEAQARFAGDRRFEIEQGSFAMLQHYMESRGWMGRVAGILLDLGVSSPQLDDPARGFSFMREGPLDMRMDPASGQSAADWLATASAQEIAGVLREFGEERFAKRIAGAIVSAREEAPIATTKRLAEIVAAAQPTREPGKHPATRTFQALRIFINRELDDLEQVLPQTVHALAPGGRLAVISFHSLEDRIVKRFMRDEARGGDFPADLPITADRFQPRLRTVGKPQYACAEEVDLNPRARSAVLRVAERV